VPLVAADLPVCRVTSADREVCRHGNNQARPRARHHRGPRPADREVCRHGN